MLLKTRVLMSGIVRVADTFGRTVRRADKKAARRPRLAERCDRLALPADARVPLQRIRQYSAGTDIGESCRRVGACGLNLEAGA